MLFHTRRSNSTLRVEAFQVGGGVDLGPWIILGIRFAWATYGFCNLEAALGGTV